MLDALNEDCRRYVLSYLPVKDILRAERVSRSWQHVVLQYLRGVRIRIEHDLYHYEETHGPKCRILKLYTVRHPKPNWFEQITEKLGCSIVASYCYNERVLMIITRNCPNLEHLVLMKLSPPFRLTLTDQVIHMKRLKQMTFWYFFDITDDYISKFLGNDNLEALTIFCGSLLTGRCLTSLKSTNLRSLRFTSCYCLDLNYLLSALEDLPEITKLELTTNSSTIFQNAHLLLNKVPKLEELALNQKQEIVLNGNIPESISRLDRLKILDLSSSPNVTDEWLAMIASGCKKLQELNIENCSVSARAVTEFCRAAGSELKVLNVAIIKTIDDNCVTACINTCPKLETIDVSFCPVTGKVPIHLAARARPLCILCTRTQLRKIKEPKKLYPWLTLNFESDDNTSSDSDEEDDDENREVAWI